MKPKSSTFREVGGTLFYLIAAGVLALCGVGFHMLFSGIGMMDSVDYAVVVTCFVLAALSLGRAVFQKSQS